MNSIRLTSQSDTPSTLVLMFHGVGSSPRAMLPLGEYLQQHNPDWAISLIQGPYPSPLNPKGFHWFDITGITEANRMGRVLEALPVFDRQIRDEATTIGVPLNKVVLVGFSQGTIMSLEWFKQSREAVTGIVAISGRFAELPEQPLECNVPVCIIHGEGDEISSPNHARQSAQSLKSLAIKTELHLLKDTPHRITGAMYSLIEGFIRQQL